MVNRKPTTWLLLCLLLGAICQIQEKIIFFLLLLPIFSEEPTFQYNRDQWIYVNFRSMNAFIKAQFYYADKSLNIRKHWIETWKQYFFFFQREKFHITWWWEVKIVKGKQMYETLNRSDVLLRPFDAILFQGKIENNKKNKFRIASLYQLLYKATNMPFRITAYIVYRLERWY